MEALCFESIPFESVMFTVADKTITIGWDSWFIVVIKLNDT